MPHDPFTDDVAALATGAAVPVDAVPGVGRTHLPVAEDPVATRLGTALEASRTWSEAQGVLAGLAGCTPQRAGQVLRRFGVQLSLPAPAALAGFFLACLRVPDGQTRALIAAIVSAAHLGAPSAVSTRPTRGQVSAPVPPAGAPGEAQLLPAGIGIAVRGDLDIAAAPLLTLAFIAHQEVAGTGGVVLLDLHEMTFCDVAGVRALAAVHAGVTGHPGGRLHVNRPTRFGPHRMLHLAVSWGWLPPEFIRGGPTLTRASTEGVSRARPPVSDAGPPPAERALRPVTAPATSYLGSGLFSRGALIAMLVPPEQDLALAAAVATWLTGIARRGRGKVLVLDLRWAVAPGVARWWIQQVLRIRLPLGSSVIAVNAPESVRTTADVTVLPVGADPGGVIRTAYRLVGATSVPVATEMSS